MRVEVFSAEESIYETMDTREDDEPVIPAAMSVERKTLYPTEFYRIRGNHCVYFLKHTEWALERFPGRVVNLPQPKVIEVDGISRFSVSTIRHSNSRTHPRMIVFLDCELRGPAEELLRYECEKIYQEFSSIMHAVDDDAIRCHLRDVIFLLDTSKSIRSDYVLKTGIEPIGEVREEAGVNDVFRVTVYTEPRSIEIIVPKSAEKHMEEIKTSVIDEIGLNNHKPRFLHLCE